MLCGECGAENPDTNQFCVNCGKPLKNTEPHPESGPARTPADFRKPGIPKIWILAGVIIVLVIIVVAILAFGVLGTGDPVVGTWTVGSTGLRMEFDANGTATLRYPDTGYFAAGRWEKVAEGKYRLSSAKGTQSPLLSYDPVADALHTDDFSMIFTRTG
jgi:hypothetical protein